VLRAGTRVDAGGQVEAVDRVDLPVLEDVRELPLRLVLDLLLDARVGSALLLPVGVDELREGLGGLGDLGQLAEVADHLGQLVGVARDGQGGCHWFLLRIPSRWTTRCCW
jgi:hypothetical protein